MPNIDQRPCVLHAARSAVDRGDMWRGRMGLVRITPSAGRHRACRQFVPVRPLPTSCGVVKKWEYVVDMLGRFDSLFAVGRQFTQNCLIWEHRVNPVAAHNFALHPTATIAAHGVLRPPCLLRMAAAERNVGHTWAFPSVILRKRP
jgi:hypothetical protein